MENSRGGILLGPQSHTIKTARYRGDLAVPTFVVDPLYPPSLVVMGAAVFRLKITSSGAVAEVRAIQELGNLTASAAEAVRKWKFLPAKDRADQAVASNAYAICVYRPLQTQPLYP
jgi:hypothetical protein